MDSFHFKEDSFELLDFGNDLIEQKLVVAVGNESALDFYSKYNFVPVSLNSIK